MPYIWEFETGDRPLEPIGRRCHRGPMTALEEVMSKPFKTFIQIELLRNRVLDNVTDTHLRAVQTREVVLRVLNSNLGPIFIDQWNIYAELNVLICERKSSAEIDEALRPLDRLYLDSLDLIEAYGIEKNYLNLMREALTSNSVVLRVAARCAVIVAAATLELQIQAG